LRRGFQDTLGKNREKVGLDPLPVDLANAGDFSRQRNALQLKFQFIAHANSEVVGNAFFQRNRYRLSIG
jgi:hypothetical protein